MDVFSFICGFVSGVLICYFLCDKVIKNLLVDLYKAKGWYR